MNSEFRQAGAALPNAQIVFEKTLATNGRGETLDPLASVQYRVNCFKTDLNNILEDGEQNGIPFPEEKRSQAYQQALAPVLDMAVELANFTCDNPAGGFTPTTVSFQDNVIPYRAEDAEFLIIDALHTYIDVLRADEKLDFDAHPLPLAINHPLRHTPDSDDAFIHKCTDVLSNHSAFTGDNTPAYAPKSSVTNYSARETQSTLDQEVAALRR